VPTSLRALCSLFLEEVSTNILWSSSCTSADDAPSAAVADVAFFAALTFLLPFGRPSKMPPKAGVTSSPSTSGLSLRVIHTFFHFSQVWISMKQCMKKNSFSLFSSQNIHRACFNLQKVNKQNNKETNKQNK
jgi:hypothetical protein